MRFAQPIVGLESAAIPISRKSRGMGFAAEEKEHRPSESPFATTWLSISCSISGRVKGKNLRLCRVGAFENPQFSQGVECPRFGSHSRVGLQAPSIFQERLPCGCVVGSSKGNAYSRAPQRSWRPLPAIL